MKNRRLISSFSGRVTEWWWYIVPFLSSIGYFFIFLFRVPIKEAVATILLFIVTISATAAFGYFLNDVTDIETDLKAGKRNFASSNSLIKNLLILSLLLIIALLPWVFLPKNLLNISLYLFQLLLLVIYSIPPFRLKKFPIPGVITDALYNSVVPLWVVGSTFFLFSAYKPDTSSLAFISIATIWVFFKGIRGILLHQTGDRKNDRRANLNTFVVHYGPYRTFKLMFYGTFRIEILAFTLLVVYLSFRYFPFLFLVIPFFLIYLFLYLRLWENVHRRRKELRFDFLFIINDLYEEWLPIIFLIYLTILNPLFSIILFFHLILFYKIVIKFYRNSQKNLSNLSDFGHFFSGRTKQYLNSKFN